MKKIHPLGKAPIITIAAPGAAESIVLAETGPMVEYIIDHFGKHLVPKRWQEGKEGQICGETESWLRNRYFMHYAEGSFMSFQVVALIMGSEHAHPLTGI